MPRCRWTNEEYVMIQSVWDREHCKQTCNDFHMAAQLMRNQSPCCGSWRTLIMHSVWSALNAQMTALLLSAKTCCKSRFRCTSCCRTHNPHNKYWPAISINWHMHDWCDCRRAGWMDGTDQPDEVRQQSSGCIWPSPSPVKQGTDITQ